MFQVSRVFEICEKGLTTDDGGNVAQQPGATVLTPTTESCLFSFEVGVVLCAVSDKVEKVKVLRAGVNVTHSAPRSALK